MPPVTESKAHSIFISFHFICVAGESFNVRMSRSAFPDLTKDDLVLGDLELSDCWREGRTGRGRGDAGRL